MNLNSINEVVLILVIMNLAFFICFSVVTWVMVDDTRDEVKKNKERLRELRNYKYADYVQAAQEGSYKAIVADRVEQNELEQKEYEMELEEEYKKMKKSKK